VLKVPVIFIETIFGTSDAEELYYVLLLIIMFVIDFPTSFKLQEDKN
jgi:hypothetical protein